MYFTPQFIITAAGVVSAIGVLIGVLFKVYRWYLKQQQQDVRLAKIEQHHETDVSSIKTENRLICYALSACLDGLQQLGCNHTVPKAKKELDEYLNEQAHR